MLNLRSLRAAARERGRRVRSVAQCVEQCEDRVMLSSAAFAVTSDWGSGFGGQITISNTQTAAVSNWTLSFNWDRAITQIWDGSIVSHTGNQYVITNAGWNGTIAPGGTAEFGFNGGPGNVGSDVPTSYALNGVALGGAVLPSLSINNVSVNDGAAGATAQFTVTLSKAATGTITVGYGTADGTAKAGTDYKAVSGTLTFKPGTTSQTISVPINPDTTAKPNETFQVNLANAVGASLVNTAGTGTIVDTIPAPPPKTSRCGIVRGHKRLGDRLWRRDHDQQQRADGDRQLDARFRVGSFDQPDLERVDREPYGQSVCDHQRRLECEHSSKRISLVRVQRHARERRNRRAHGLCA